MRLLCKSHCIEFAAALHPLFLRVCAVKGLIEFCSGSDTCSLLLSIVITRWDFCNGLPLCCHQFSRTKTHRHIYVFIILTDHNSKCILKNPGAGIPCTVTYPWPMSVLVFLLIQSYMLKSVNGIMMESLCGKDMTGTWSEFHVGLMFINNCTAGNANESLNKVMVNIQLS